MDHTYPLLAHLLDSAAMGAFLYQHWLRPGLRNLIEKELGTDTEKIVSWVIGTHDIGKANPIFQFQPTQSDDSWAEIRNGIRNSGFYEPVQSKQLDRWLRLSRELKRHEKISALDLSGGNLAAINLGEAWRLVPPMAHHGYFSVPLQAARKPQKQAARQLMESPGWAEARRDLKDALSTAIGVRIDDAPKKVSPTVTILISGLTVLADRLASNQAWIAETLARDLSLSDPETWYQVQREAAKPYVARELGLYQGWESQEEAEHDILRGRSPREVQEKVRDAGDGLVAVMAPTGCGKTEAALLRHAQKDERLLFLLPTQATTNALMRRVQRAYANTPNVASLAHGLASVEDFYTTPVVPFSDDNHEHDECAHEQGGLFPGSFVRAGMSRMLASVSVATVDQALKASLKIKWVHLLLLSFANAHVVIDEVHTLDHYQTVLAETLLAWLGATGSRVTLLTATFPSWQFNRLLGAYSGEKQTMGASFPAIARSTAKEAESFPADPRQLHIELDKLHHPDNVRSHIEWAEAARARYPQARIGIICNQVAWAQRVAHQLRDKGHTVVVLHSAMTSQHRRDNAEYLEKELGPEGSAEGITVVGTQAIEASLDIDLDILSTDLCPSASLIQRAGRVWRRIDATRAHRVPGMDQATIRVVDALDTNDGFRFPYREAELQRTSAWLSAREGLRMPEECQEFVDASSVTFGDLDNEDATDADTDMFAEDARKTQKGRSVSYSMKDFLDPDTSLTTIGRTFGGLGNMISPDASEVKTRDIEEESVRVILGDSTGTIPGAWDGTLEELQSVKGFQQDQVRRALAGSMPMRRRKFDQVSDKAVSLEQSRSVISQFWYVEAKDLYDPFVGYLGASISDTNEVK
ncbi:CRISPR-associated helicase/endonuclease Cas3 [Corynebacterium yudongzhengii]|uniref:CRISPR-associated helicase Cas3 n=1 Tax=Corynebacterium yudongzhengii TaxID=2080740 RepID=A0A2U1T454_9CORY|nr:CRISPR-associated helicase/endonuclease Cas3 [Corynebacterium yudongzhengii]PWC00745.1 CRISPR-associated helicase Cas3' [Corynebacterium yudongzhengii]